MRLPAQRLRRHVFPPPSRNYSSRIAHDPSKIRNMALVAHIDSGKTTLTESILLKSSYLTTRGSVDTGSTTTDFLPAERERGITIQSASIPVKWKDWTFNLIDTPGHADFGMEVESASRVIDGAVVLIDSVEGVEAQTKGVWRQLDRYQVPTRMVFLNKLDRPGASFRSSTLSILSNRLHPHPMPLTLPIASFDPHRYTLGEPGIEGLVDLVKWQVWRRSGDGQATCHVLPRDVDALNQLDFIPSSHPILPHLIAARTQLLENLSMFSEELMELLLGLPSGSPYLPIEASSITRYLRQATLNNEILPVVCGSAILDIGTQQVMDYIGELLASPLDIALDNQSEKTSFKALAWKVGWDKKRGWMTFVRVYSGKLTRQSVILNTTRNQRERVSKLLLLYASNTQEVEELPFGSVGVILGLRFTRTGDTLVSAGSPHALSDSSLRDISLPASVMSASIIPQSYSDMDPVQDALRSLSRTDPSVRYDTQEGQILVHGMGSLHLEIIERRLRDEWGVRFEFGKRRVSYREGLGSDPPSENWNNWEADAGGKRVSISINLNVRRIEDEEGDPAWDGNIVLDEKNNPLPNPDSLTADTPRALIARGIASSLWNSPHTSLGLSHLHIQIGTFSIPPGVPLSMLTGASANILRRRIREAGLGPIMEPYVHLKVSVPEASLGKVVKDLTENGSEVLDLGESSGNAVDGTEGMDGFSPEALYMPPTWLSPSGGQPTDSSGSKMAGLRRTVRALAPLSKVLDYSDRLRAISGGHGLFEMHSAGFQQVSEPRKLEILKEIGRA